MTYPMRQYCIKYVESIIHIDNLNNCLKYILSNCSVNDLNNITIEEYTDVQTNEE